MLCFFAFLLFTLMLICLHISKKIDMLLAAQRISVILNEKQNDNPFDT